MVCCPYCGSDDVEHVDADEDVITGRYYRHYECLTCHDHFCDDGQ
jgi:hypothetical protein